MDIEFWKAAQEFLMKWFGRIIALKGGIISKSQSLLSKSYCYYHWILGISTGLDMRNVDDGRVI